MLESPTGNDYAEPATVLATNTTRTRPVPSIGGER
jgi:hypothetical protein